MPKKRLVVQVDVTRPDRACERQSLLLPLQESRSLDPAQRRDPRKRERDEEKETEIPAYAKQSFASAYASLRRTGRQAGQRTWLIIPPFAEISVRKDCHYLIDLSTCTEI